MLQTQQVLQERYQLQQQLGQNSGRQTWLATDISQPSAPQVIVKLLAFNPQMHWDELKLFEREAQVLNHLNHPRIPQYYTHFSISQQTGRGLPWFGLVQEYIPGKSLQELLNQGERFTEQQVYEIASSILEILIYLHELSPPVFHRDIKPSNLILGEDGKIYLVDFGAVQDRATAEGATFTVVGTSGYSPPEQLWGRAVPASDLYALGATLIHLLTGTAPVDLPQRQMRIQFCARVTLNSHFAQWLETITEPVPERRFSTARQALEALKASEELSFAAEPKQGTLKSSVRYGRLAGLAIIQFAIIGFGLMMLPSFFEPGIPKPTRNQEWQAKQNRHQQWHARRHITSMNQFQQETYRRKNVFVNARPDIDLGIPVHTETYKYSTRLTDKAVFNYAIAQNDSLKSYVGGVFEVPQTDFYPALQGKTATIGIVCEANFPGITTTLPEPIYDRGELRCGSGTSELPDPLAGGSGE